MNRVHPQASSKYASTVLVTSLALVVFAFWIARFSATALGHDQVVLLHDAEGFLGGYTIYGPYLSETNPPLMIWFSTIPVVLAHHLAGSSVFWFRSMLFFLICCSVIWSARLLRRSNRVTNGLALTLCAFSILGIELSNGGYDFGQREHVLIILLLPYLLGIATGAVERISFVERSLLGIVAGCAVWFKPQDILVVIGAEIACALWTRTLRRLVSVEFIAMFSTACFLLMSVFLFTPLYIHQVVPLLLDVYWALGTNSFSSVLLASHRYLLILFIAILCYFALLRRLTDKRTPLVLLASSVAGFIAYGVQHTKWNYHQFPHRSLVLLALSYMLVDVLRPLWIKIGDGPLLANGPLLALSGCALLLVFALVRYPAVVRKPPEVTGSASLNRFLDQIQPGTTVSALSTSVDVMAAVYDHHLRWGSRFAHLWMMPAVIQNELGRNSHSSPFKQLSPETTARVGALQRQEVTEDLIHWRPDIVLVSICTPSTECTGMQGKKVDVLAWFERSPEFSKTWSQYVRQPGIEGFDVYRLAHR